MLHVRLKVMVLGPLGFVWSGAQVPINTEKSILVATTDRDGWFFFFDGCVGAH